MVRKVEEALAAWRDAQRRLDNAVDGDRDALQTEVERLRTLFHQLSAEHMMDRIDALHEAEDRRQTATPSTEPFHTAARDEMHIAAEIWESARFSDEDTRSAKPREDAWAEGEIARLKADD
ncbi:MAG TPA: hypothetical protein VMZ33_02150 [Candidatus Limnocylindrales bacterium]|nr:hypothetical protein [Candidatus Limnocylindrales bacterium]